MSWNLYVHTSECMGRVHVPSFSVLKETLCLDRRDPYSHGCRRGPEGDTTRYDVNERHGWVAWVVTDDPQFADSCAQLMVESTDLCIVRPLVDSFY